MGAIGIAAWTAGVYVVGWAMGRYGRRGGRSSPSVTPLRGAAIPPDDTDPTASILANYSETMRVGYPMAVRGPRNCRICGVPNHSQGAMLCGLPYCSDGR